MNNLDLIETERLILRGWRPEEAPDLFRLHGNAETARYLTEEGRAWTMEECVRTVGTYIELFESRRMGKLRLIRKSDGVFIGRAGYGLYPPDDTPEIGYALLPEFRGEGYATEAAGALRDWIFRETDHEYFVGFADLRNAASLAVLQRIGMTKTRVELIDGIMGQLHTFRREDLT